MSDDLPGADEERARVAAVLARLEAGVRQRQAEVATLGTLAAAGEAPADEAMQGRLLQLQQSEFVREPVPTSHRARLGRWIVFGRKGTYHLLLKWLVRPLLEQQNAFNQAASVTLRELVQTEERLRRQVAELERRLGALEAAKQSLPADGHTGDATGAADAPAGSAAPPERRG